MNKILKSLWTITLLVSYCNIAFCSSIQNLPAKAFIKDNNVYVAFTNGTQKQLTFNNSDRNPVLLSKVSSVIYIRETKGRTGNSSYTTKKIMKVDINSLLETNISDQKPYKDGLDFTFEILNVINPTLSLDENFLIFGTEKYVTGNQIVKVDLESGKWQELFSANSFELIKKGPYKGLFLIGTSRVGYKGREIYFKLCNEMGEAKKEFDNEDSMMKFRSEIK